MVALSQECKRLLEILQLENVEAIDVADLEARYPSLALCKKNRSLVEYYFTCTPSVISFVFDDNPLVNQVTYIDADMFFYNDPAIIFSEIGDASVAITPHRFAAEFLHNEKYGIYNVGLLSFRRDAVGLECLKEWQRNCIEWCYDRLEDGKFADQKYLDSWPVLYPNVVSIQHEGVNAGIWNIGEAQWSIVDNSVCINRKPLVLFHFHGIKEVVSDVYDVSWKRYKISPSRVLVDVVYSPYFFAWARAARLVQPLLQMKVESNLRAEGNDKGKSRFRRLRHWMRAYWQVFLGRYFWIKDGCIIKAPRW